MRCHFNTARLVNEQSPSDRRVAQTMRFLLVVVGKRSQAKEPTVREWVGFNQARRSRR